MKQLLCGAVAILCGTQLYAQYVTPSLDSTYGTSSPAASAWNFSSTAAVGYMSVKSKLKESPTSERDYDQTQSSPHGLLAYKEEFLAAEVEYFGGSSTGKNKSSSVDLDLTGNQATTHFFANYLIAERAAIGIGLKQNNSTLKAETTAIDLKYDTKELTYSLGFSCRVTDYLFLGANWDSVESSGMYEYNDSKKDYRKNSWTEMGFGGALLFGDPEDVQVRLEFHSSVSPESIKSATDNEVSNHHQKTTTQFGALEVKVSNYLVMGRIKKTNEAELSDNNTIEKYEQDTQFMEAGIGYMPLEGLIFSATAIHQEGIEKKSEGDEKVESTAYTMSIGYNF